MSKIIGIDLGTSTSEVAYLKNGKPYIIPNHLGKKITPSVVGITEDKKRIIGEEAKEQWILRPQDTVVEIKRKMGSKEKVEMAGEEYTPEQISSFILIYLKECAEQYIGEPIDRAVITVPAYFTDEQRRATVEAGRLAGFKVERILNEPTAAALTYGIDHMEEDQHILVYDLGGGTLDVTVLEMFTGVLEVKASSGNNTLGGKDFDERLVEYVLKQFESKHNLQLSNDLHAMVRIKSEAERCKIALSTEHTYTITLPFITEKDGQPLSLEETVTQDLFKDLIWDLIESTAKSIEIALKDASLQADDIDLILMVGGSTRIPFVKEFLQNVLQQEPKALLDPDLAVTMGAAIQAAIQNEELSPESDLLITDVCPYTLGIEIIGVQGGFYVPDVLDVLIPRNTTIPTTKEKTYFTVVDDQDTVEIVVYQGDNKRASLNHHLGNFLLKDIPTAPAGEEKVKVRFMYDVNGILQVEAINIKTGNQAQIMIDITDVQLEKEVDIDTWEQSKKAKKYKYILRKAQKYIESNPEDEDDLEAMQDLIYELKKALVLEQSDEELSELEDEITELLDAVDEQ